MSPRLTDESGFTLVELLATMMVGGIILFALFGLIDTATKRQAMATDRIDANDRGRAAIDSVSAQLRSRVCVSAAQGSLVSATPSTLEFFASLGITPESTTQSQRLVLQRRRLTYRPEPNNDVVEEVWVGSSPPPTLPAGPPTAATRTRTLLTNVALEGTTPFFAYYALGDATTGQTLATPQLLSSTLTTAELATQTRRNVRIDVSLAAKGRVGGVSTPLQTQITDRSPGCYFG